MEAFKAICNYNELCELIKEGATLCKHYGLNSFNYSLNLSEEQQKKYKLQGSNVSKTIGRKFANQSHNIIETKTTLAGYSYEYTYKK